MIDKNRLAQNLTALKEISPLVHNITNYVTMNNSANALLALGASPVMAHAVNEMNDMVLIAGALVINIGTLDDQWVDGMLTAGIAMHRLGRPIILDPVGAGATPYRTTTCWKIINECHPTIIRGNGSEIMALINADVQSKGVDSSVGSSPAVESAKELSKRTKAVVVISGETDYIVQGDRVETVANGATIMTKVTAMGCTASSVVGAFAAVDSDPFVAAYTAMAVMGIAGQRAAAHSAGPGSMQVNFLDELYNLTAEVLINELRQ